MAPSLFFFVLTNPALLSFLIYSEQFFVDSCESVRDVVYLYLF
jgi:hypothetical protein